MPAVVRVKRRIDEEPLGAFILNGKKRRLNDTEPESNASANKEEISTILKFAGTVESQDESATTRFARLTKEQAKELVQKSRKPTNPTERSRQDMRHHIQENRFKVVNCFRTAIHDDKTNENEANGCSPLSKEVTIVDIEKQQRVATPPVCNSQNDTPSTSSSAQIAQQHNTSNNHSHQQPSDSDTGFVYDLYLPENEQQAENVDLMDDNHLSFRVRAFDDLVFEDTYNDDDDDHFSSEDSNAEDYAGNDYPDEESDNSIGEREMRRAVEKMTCGDSDEDLSDDDDYDNIYTPYNNSSGDFQQDRFVYDVDHIDTTRFGSSYEQYRSRVLRELEELESDENSDMV